MDSIAWNIGVTFCHWADALNLTGYLGDVCADPQQFGFLLAVSFVIALALIWLFKPK